MKNVLVMSMLGFIIGFAVAFVVLEEIDID
jgi:uncharacterized membrane protein SpoIIM required for sporulation